MTKEKQVSMLKKLVKLWRIKGYKYKANKLAHSIEVYELGRITLQTLISAYMELGSQ